MPYRAMIWTIVTVGLALMAMGFWIRAVEPMLAGVEADTAATTNVYAASPTTAQSPQKAMRRLVQGTMLLSFLLICLLLIVGLAATFREWVRYGAGTTGRMFFGSPKKTRYVDAWKIAGERVQMEPGKPPPGEGDSGSADLDDDSSRL